MYDRPVAPYADKPIELSLLSITARRHRTFYCVECHHPFLQRDNEVVYRINTDDEPVTARIWGNVVQAKCARCTQKYTVTITLIPGTRIVDNMQRELQSMYITAEETKAPRYLRCLECGHTFCSVADRISRIVDNVVPLEYMSVSKVAFIESRCDVNRCRQRWALMV